MTQKGLDEMTSYVKRNIRDFKLQDILGDSNKLELEPFKIGLMRFKKKKMINQLFDMGAILVGSRALSMYRYNGHKLIDRKISDLDFVLDKDNILKFCGLNGITDIDYNDNHISISLTLGLTLGIRSGNDYGGKNMYLFRNDVDIISKENIPFTEFQGMKIATLENIILNKLKLVESNGRFSKHIIDLNTFIAKISAYKK